MTLLSSSLLAVSLLAPLPLAPLPADHGDTPLLASLGRPDARLTDLHVFTNGDRLVIAVALGEITPEDITGVAQEFVKSGRQHYGKIIDTTAGSAPTAL